MRLSSVLLVPPQDTELAHLAGGCMLDVYVRYVTVLYLHHLSGTTVKKNSYAAWQLSFHRRCTWSPPESESMLSGKMPVE